MAVQLNLHSYVALGDSITAGYADGALFYDGQQHAYPQVMARQFNTLQNCAFKQAFLQASSVGIGFFGNSRLELKPLKNCTGEEVFHPAYIASRGDLKAFATNNYTHEGPYNNMGIPGAKAISLLVPGYGNPDNGTGNYNPFFTRMASNPYAVSILADAVALRPTFFSLFIGNNDALAFALSGGTMDIITPFNGPPGIGFEGSMHTIVNELTAHGAQGIIATIPDCMDIPYFKTVFFNSLYLTTEEALTLNEMYQSHAITFKTGSNCFVMEDHLKPGHLLSLSDQDLILADILLDSDRCEYLKGRKPLPKKYVLLHGEIRHLLNVVEKFNSCIYEMAEEKNLALADVRAFVKKLNSDREYQAQNCCVKYSPAALFSLDGVHLSAAGQLMLANVFIEAINTHYEQNIPLTL